MKIKLFITVLAFTLTFFQLPLLVEARDVSDGNPSCRRLTAYEHQLGVAALEESEASEKGLRREDFDAIVSSLRLCRNQDTGEIYFEDWLDDVEDFWPWWLPGGVIVWVSDTVVDYFQDEGYFTPEPPLV